MPEELRAGIGSSMPVTLVRINSSDNGWMNRTAAYSMLSYSLYVATYHDCPIVKVTHPLFFHLLIRVPNSNLSGKCSERQSWLECFVVIFVQIPHHLKTLTSRLYSFFLALPDALTPFVPSQSSQNLLSE